MTRETKTKCFFLTCPVWSSINCVFKNCIVLLCTNKTTPTKICCDVYQLQYKIDIFWNKKHTQHVDDQIMQDQKVKRFNLTFLLSNLIVAIQEDTTSLKYQWQKNDEQKP